MTFDNHADGNSPHVSISNYPVKRTNQSLYTLHSALVGYPFILNLTISVQQVQVASY